MAIGTLTGPGSASLPQTPVRQWRYSYPVRRLSISRTMCLFLPLVALSAAAAQLFASQAATSDATYSLTGTVQISVTGEPVAHALVQIFSGTSQSTFTDAGGRFEFDKLPAGITTLVARKPGFFTPEEMQGADRIYATVSGRHFDHREGPSPAVRIGPDAPPVTLKLVPEAVIFGRAQKPDGEPIAFLTVQLFYFQIADGRKSWNLMNSAHTNEDGEFRIAGLRAGRYYLGVGPRWQTTWIGAPGQRAREAAYRPIFYPGVSDLSSATPLDVSAGQQVEADLSLSPEPVFRISGSIVGLPATESADQIWPRIQINSQSNNLEAMPVAAEAGNEFHAKAPAGSYILHADVDTPLGPLRGDIPINVRSDVEGINLVVAPNPPPQVEVVVQRTRGTSQPGRQPTAQVNLHFIPQMMKLPSGDIMISAGSGGTNFVQALEPGTYAMEVTALTQDLYVDSAQCGGTDLLREDLAVGRGRMPPIRILLRDDGGTLSGSVLSDGHGAPGTVLLIPDRAPRQIKSVYAGPGGEFRSSKLAPGDYAVLAFDRVTGLEYTNPEVLNAYLPNATHASVSANGESKISVNLIRTTK